VVIAPAKKNKALTNIAPRAVHTTVSEQTCAVSVDVTSISSWRA